VAEALSGNGWAGPENVTSFPSVFSMIHSAAAAHNRAKPSAARYALRMPVEAVLNRSKGVFGERGDLAECCAWPGSSGGGRPSKEGSSEDLTETSASKRYPRRGIVLMRRGPSFPSARRSSPILCTNASSVTARLGHTAAKSSSLETRRPGFPARYFKTPKVLGRSEISLPSRKRQPRSISKT
jgi:hypothetical protein